MNTLLGIISLLALGGISPAETVVVPGLQGLGETRYHRIESANMERGYDVLVGLPVGYDTSGDVDYPTIYILDGGALYPMLRSYYNYLRHSSEVPESILVAISYGSDDFEYGNTRGHDYTAPSPESEHYGGAQAFRTFLSDELLPQIEAEYHSASDRRVLFGQSIGGQFVLFAAQTEPSLFHGYIASNPALHRNLESFLEPITDGPTIGDRPRLFVGSGSHDAPLFRVPALQWIEHWTAVENIPWDLRAVTLEGHTHFSTPPASFRQGLRWLFADPEESL